MHGAQHALAKMPAANTLSTSTTSSYQVIKRTGDAVPFQPDKIAAVITKAILAVEGQSASGSSRVKSTVDQLVNDITRRITTRLPQGGAVHIEEIQDQVELGLMRLGMQKTARAYVLYREAHARQRPAPVSASAPALQVRSENGTLHTFAPERIAHLLDLACQHLSGVNTETLYSSIHKSLYDGMREVDVLPAMIMAARQRIEEDPDYAFAAARLLRHQLAQEAAGLLNLSLPQSLDTATYQQFFRASIEHGITCGLLSPALQDFDLARLAEALLPERDRQFSYLGLQTLYDRYFLHWQDTRFELPQVFFMRVAMGLAIQEDHPTERAIEFYSLLSSFDYMCSTPTLFNAGTPRPQLSSCYLTTVPDDLEGIYGAIRDNALLSKWAGGLGNDWTPVRALGAHIRGTNGKSQGVVPFLKVVNDSAVAVNQGGKRKGAVCAYLECWHLDVEEFLELRKNTGDDRRRTHDMNSALWIPDLFMKRVFEEGEWTLFSPSDAPDLHDLYGAAFEARYLAYEAQVDEGTLRLAKRLPAVQLWRKMLSMLFETGHPWLTFKDPCNVRSPQQHAGVVHSSNLCTEITLNTSEDEIAVCNLGSINLANHITAGALDHARLRRTIHTAVRLLDNVIDINFYPVPQAEKANLRHRPIGLGLMGFQDALYQLKLPYASIEAVHFADQAMEAISFYALEASALLAQARGTYPSYAGSLWSQGVLPIDSVHLLSESRGATYTLTDTTCQLDWQPVRDLIQAHGMRNSNVMAIAPTATISNIVGVSQSIEPTYQNLFVKSNLSGEFTVINAALVGELKALQLWDEVMINDLKYYDGSLQQIDRIPAEIKARYATAFDIDPRWLVEAAARRQKWIDQAQSLNLYMAEPSGKMLDNLYKTAWTRGLKTTYYLRSLGATHQEKHSLATGDEPSGKAELMERTEVAEHTSTETSPAFCSLLDPECEACQ